jgi:haloalkane dehalogenase
MSHQPTNDLSRRAFLRLGLAVPAWLALVPAIPPMQSTSPTRRQQSGDRTMPSATFPFQKQRAQILGRTMAYVDVGQGDPIVLLHGNPTSSYLWRNVIPHLEGLGRCIAPDLIGMGDSDKLPDSGPASYTFVEHRRYLDALLETLGVTERVTFVIHDWGSALGFDWANRHREAVKGLAYMEAIVRPFTWEEFPPQARPIFEALRSPAGEELVLEQNLFVERNLPATILRTLSDEEMNEYRRPFLEPGEARRPTLSWPRQIPLDGEPPDVAEIVAAYADWLPGSSVPKLFVKGDPGTYSGAVLEFCRTWRAQAEVTVRGVHYLQEDSPDQIGQAIAEWLRGLA